MDSTFREESVDMRHPYLPPCLRGVVTKLLLVGLSPMSHWSATDFWTLRTKLIFSWKVYLFLLFCGRIGGMVEGNEGKGDISLPLLLLLLSSIVAG
jgi:hypothetical protein